MHATAYCHAAALRYITWPVSAYPMPKGAGFVGPRFQSVSTTSDAHHRALTNHPADGQRLGCTPDSRIVCGRYSLKLYIDPLFPKVPASPGFPSTPCAVSSASEAYESGNRHPLAADPGGGACTRFRCATGIQTISCLDPFPRRPIPWTEPGVRPGRLGRRRHCSRQRPS